MTLIPADILRTTRFTLTVRHLTHYIHTSIINEAFGGDNVAATIDALPINSQRVFTLMPASLLPCNTLTDNTLYEIE